MICEHCGKEALCYGILSNGREVAWCYDCIKEPDHEESRLASIGESLAVYMTKCEELETECLTLRDAARHQEAMAVRWQALRPEVRVFAEAMERKLQANDHKGGWEGMPLSWLRGRLTDESKELDAAIAAYINDIGNRDLSKPRQAILCECADIGNFAMMIAANCKSLETAAALGSMRGYIVYDDEGAGQ